MAAEAVFGHYRLLALLGRGGMGEVWRAHDTRKDRDVALKVLGAWLGAEPDYTRRFRREAALAARLNSPNIIPIHDYGEIDDRLYIEMPLIDGVDLDALLAREGPLPPTRVVGIIEQVADALDVAHEAGLVHRDVKPSNVLVSTRRGRDFVYLIDFGIARSLDSTSISHTGAVVGTLAYMAPERFEGEGDHRGDVYALACVLYAALTGQPPFTAPSGAFPLGFYLDAHRSQDPPRPSRLAPDVPAGFDAIIARGMAKQPTDRYPTTGDLGTAAHVALGMAAHAAPASPPAPTGPARLFGPHGGGQTKAGPTPPGPPTATTTAGGGTPPTDSPITGEPTALDSDSSAPSTVIAAVVTTAPRRGPAGLAASSTVPFAHPRRSWPRSRKILLAIGLSVALLAGLVTLLTTQGTISNPGITERSMAGHTGSVRALATAQLNGRPVVISGSDDQTVRVWDLATGQPVGAPFTGHTGFVFAVATAQLNGRPVVISGSYDGTVRVWDLATGQPVGAPFTGHTGPVNAVATAQLNGRPVAISGSDDGTVRVWDLATGQPVGAPFTPPPVWPSPAVFAVATAQLSGRPVVVFGSTDYKVHVWDLATGQPVGAPFTGHTDNVRAVATAQLNGRPVVISGSYDGTVRVWDLATGQPVGAPFTGHTGFVFAVTTAQLNGRPVVISGGTDDTVQMSDLATGQPVGAPFTGHTDYVRAVATAQLDGRPAVISGSDDRMVRVWDLAGRAHS